MDETDASGIWVVFNSDEISNVLNIEALDIDHKYPVQEVSTGLPFIIVPLRHWRL